MAQQQLLLSNNGSSSDSMTMSTTNAMLARAFGIVVRTIADLLSLLQDYGPLTPPLNRMLDISYNEAIRYNMFYFLKELKSPNKLKKNLGCYREDNSKG